MHCMLNTLRRRPCRHFEYERPGGRSTARASDLVRRRCWRRDATVATPASPRQEGSPASTAGAQTYSTSMKSSLLSLAHDIRVLLIVSFQENAAMTFATCIYL